VKHPFRKKWGQNFLRDPNIIRKIISCLKPDKNDVILEIGPGDGALTDELYNQVDHIHGVEIDPLLIKLLEEKPYANVSLYREDILQWDMNILPEGIKIIGNLPYYISTPILFRLLIIPGWQKMVLMFQKEVAERIISAPGKKSYGRLSVMCQAYCHVNIKFTVSRDVFQPKPDVASAVLTFIQKNETLPDISPFSDFIKQAFSQRRKKLKNNLPSAYEAGILEKYADMRPEQLSPTDYIQLFQRI
tara:strand:- start:15 stop:752 length:738 start_codon:yes stop_codon:yes gene_type:complete